MERIRDGTYPFECGEAVVDSSGEGVFRSKPGRYVECDVLRTVRGMDVTDLPVVDIHNRELEVDCDLAEVVIVELYVAGAPSWNDHVSVLTAVIQCQYQAYRRRVCTQAQGMSRAHHRPRGRCI